MSQDVLPFFDSDKQATAHAILLSGKSRKDVAHALWSHKTVDRALSDLNVALNENRDEQLSSDEHAFIANYTGQYCWLHYACYRCSHSRPHLETPAEQVAEAQAAVFSEARAIVGRLNALLSLEPKLQKKARAA